MLSYFYFLYVTVPVCFFGTVNTLLCSELAKDSRIPGFNLFVFVSSSHLFIFVYKIMFLDTSISYACMSK